MRVAVSNIAWPPEWDDRIAGVLRAAGAQGVEVAPTRLWDEPLSVSAKAIRECRAYWESHDLRIVAAQALLFGRPDLVLFDTEQARSRTLEYLGGILALCEGLGAMRAVFGSPGNRRRGELDASSADQIAEGFFAQLAARAQDHGVDIVLEANPTHYGCDYITTAAEATRMVRRVDRPGLRMHLDTGCMLLAGDDPGTAIADAGDLLCHVHVSEPNLASVASAGRVAHRDVADSLRASGYSGWVSVEMRRPEVFRPAGLADSVAFVVQHYGD